MPIHTLGCTFQRLNLAMSPFGPLRQILQRQRMSAFRVCVQPVSATPLVVGWFTEGFDTLDLKEAKALLAELAA
jgi:hypothetical protein